MGRAKKNKQQLLLTYPLQGLHYTLHASTKADSHLRVQDFPSPVYVATDTESSKIHTVPLPRSLLPLAIVPVPRSLLLLAIVPVPRSLLLLAIVPAPRSLLLLVVCLLMGTRAIIKTSTTLVDGQ